MKEDYVKGQNLAELGILGIIDKNIFCIIVIIRYLILLQFTSIKINSNDVKIQNVDVTNFI